MAKTLWNPRARDALCSRLAQLAPDATPRWGRLSAPAMLAHLIDALRMALGDLETTAPRVRRVARLLRLPPVSRAFIHVLPFPRNAPTAHALLGPPPGHRADDVATLCTLFEALVARARSPDARWPEHPFFGRISPSRPTRRRPSATTEAFDAFLTKEQVRMTARPFVVPAFP